MNESIKTQLSTTTKWNSYEEMKVFRIQDYLQRPNNAHSFMIIELDHLWDLLQKDKGREANISHGQPTIVLGRQRRE